MKRAGKRKWVILLAAAAVLLAAGVAAVFFFRNGENGGTADRTLQMQNIALKTENTALQQQSEAEKKLLQDSFEREKELLCANHRQEIELLNSHFVARTDEQEEEDFEEIEGEAVVAENAEEPTPEA